MDGMEDYNMDMEMKWNLMANMYRINLNVINRMLYIGFPECYKPTPAVTTSQK